MYQQVKKIGIEGVHLTSLNGGVTLCHRYIDENWDYLTPPGKYGLVDCVTCKEKAEVKETRRRRHRRLPQERLC